MCWLRNSLSHGGRHTRSCTSTMCIQTMRRSCSLRKPTKHRTSLTVLSGGILRLITWEILFLRTLSWESSSSSFFSLHIYQDQSSRTFEPNSGDRCFTLITCETRHQMLAKLPTHPRCRDVPTHCCANSEAAVVLHLFRMMPPTRTPVLGMENGERYLHIHVKLKKRPLEFTWECNSVQISACLLQGLGERHMSNSWKPT